MAIHYLILLSRQGKVRLAKWFTTLSPREKAKIVKDVSQLVLARRTRMCNFLEYKDTKIVYRRYASLFFIAGCSSEDNELITLEIIHRYVEQMDKYYGNVCELDIIFSFTKAYYILDELLLAGELQESSKRMYSVAYPNRIPWRTWRSRMRLPRSCSRRETDLRASL
ncbi:unnamed protein product [Parascedosporium putredinis]|uniref:AP-1 complex subunit sigma-1 n=1 Tax=Parascedosporium putredinis TaxID=1442378 RepID=A0A9P1M9V5_9PEZI|nr:unnamed protein product [Parascedosporium putredinis]CAI7995509.1 unnamed protein product [Parascedosporium putredinis]